MKSRIGKKAPVSLTKLAKLLLFFSFVKLGEVFKKLKWSELKQRFNLKSFKQMRADHVLEGAVSRLKQMSAAKSYSNYFKYGAAAFAAYYMADTVSLLLENLIPDPPAVPAPVVMMKTEKKKTIADYTTILNRNIFNSKGLIPEDDEELAANGPARKSNLPLNLIGTVVLKNELKSIATIEDKAQNMIFPLRVDDILDEKIKVTKIEHLKVYFINKANGHLEFIEILEDIPTLGVRPKNPPKIEATSSGGVTKKDDTHFEIERNTIDTAINRLPEVLQEATAIPNFENGMPDGYKVIQITPGSLFDKLGIKKNDIIAGVNGEPINDPGKAFQIFNELKSSSRLELTLKRNGRKTNVTYDIGK